MKCPSLFNVIKFNYNNNMWSKADKKKTEKPKHKPEQQVFRSSIRLISTQEWVQVLKFNNIFKKIQFLLQKQLRWL
jgi:hypothetical protein